MANNNFSDRNLSMQDEKLLKEIARLKSELQKKDQTIIYLSELLDKFKRDKFVAKSEKYSPEDSLFNEAEMLADAPLEEDEDSGDEATAATANTCSRKRGKRTALPVSLPREDILIELSEAERICSKDGSVLVEIGEEISEKLKIIPAQVTVKRIIRKKYACKTCEETIKVAPVPPSILPKTNADATLLAYIICSKFADHLPLHRLEQIFKRGNIDISRATMARWIISSTAMIQPIYNLLQDRLLAGNYLQMDETTLQVLKEKNRAATSKSYMWVRYLMGMTKIILFDYYPTRSSSVPLELLQDFKGVLQVDGYGGYEEPCETGKLIRLGCWDHCRRKFFDAFKTNNGKKLGKKALLLIDKLYKVEDEARELSSDSRHLLRQEKSIPVLAEFKQFLQEAQKSVLPKSTAGTAVIYASNQWDRLLRCFGSGEYDISNKWVENAIRPLAVGRRNWLFCDTPAGASASAMYYSLLMTAKANGLNPYDYLTNLFEKVPFAKNVEDYEALLPLKN